MKKTLIGFTLLTAALVLAWFSRDHLTAVIVIPFILGLYKLGLLIDTLPQLLWWIFTVIISFSLLFTTVRLPGLQLIRTKKRKYPGGKLDMLDGLIKETEKGSSWSGQQLALLLINIYRRSEGLPEINIHKLKQQYDGKEIPDELKPFLRSQFDGMKVKSNTATRLSLEKAVKYLKIKEMREE
ncbi:hypothetical protein [Spirochaeta isovalerica]|uniref:Uncharacterized protein n=1 Tax=Spirochaeta isovalerica TaxID=150 RepID=A0A841RA53_9SPIO|nr:hypothetical protein [Spirochaeta isovalerica]MBB6480127.1 hypothetical protein [Spirochaeta isovalerica]